MCRTHDCAYSTSRLYFNVMGFYGCIWRIWLSFRLQSCCVFHLYCWEVYKGTHREHSLFLINMASSENKDYFKLLAYNYIMFASRSYSFWFCLGAMGWPVAFPDHIHLFTCECSDNLNYFQSSNPTRQTDRPNQPYRQTGKTNARADF